MLCIICTRKRLILHEFNSFGNQKKTFFKTLNPMTSSEVNMHVEEVVVVTTPDGVTYEARSIDEEKMVMMTTELTHHEEEEVLEGEEMKSETEASTEALSKEEAVIVKLSEEEDVDADVIYQITCGDAKATLVWKKFVCPGINIKCVQFNEHLISPKQFVCLAGKSTLKDWKRAIRLNGTMLRKIMDSGELDFYQHSKVCSNTCRSTKIDLVGSRMSLSSQQSTEFVPVTPSSTDVNGSSVVFPEAPEESTEWVTAIGEDSVTFWRGVKEAGLLDEVVEDFQKEIQEVLAGMQERVTEPPLQVKDAVLLNNIVQNFGMLDLVKKVLASHKSQMDRYREQYTRSLAALEQQCDEHRKRAKELKSKSQHLNNVLMTLTPVPQTPPSPKRPRITRAMSSPATVNAAPTQITLPLSQLAGLPLGKMFTTTTAAGGATHLGGYTLITSPGGTAELRPDASNLTVLSAAAAVQDGSAGSASLVKMASPQYQLVTLPPGTTLQGLTGGAQGTVLALPLGAGGGGVTAALEAHVVGPLESHDEGQESAQEVETEAVKYEDPSVE